MASLCKKNALLYEFLIPCEMQKTNKSTAKQRAQQKKASPPEILIQPKTKSPKRK